MNALSEMAALVAPCPRCEEPVDWRWIRPFDAESDEPWLSVPDWRAAVSLRGFQMPCECELIGWTLELHYLDRDDLFRRVLQAPNGDRYSYTWGRGNPEPEQLSIEMRT